MIQLNDDTVEGKVNESRAIVLKFYADWCGPCKALEPIFAEIADFFNGEVDAASINVDSNPEATVKYGVQSLPTLVFIKEGKVINKLTGSQPKPKIEKEFEKIAL
jgi:thioredoxin 1